MGIEDIKKRIIEEAQIEAEKINRECAEKTKIIEEEGKRRAESHRGEILGAAKKRGEALFLKILTPARIASNAEILKVKHEIIESVFREVKRDLAEISDEKYGKLLRGLLKKVSIEVGEVIPKKGREKLTQEIFKGRMLSGTEEIVGGAIIKGEKMNIDFSFDSMLNGLREEMEGTLSDILFMEEK